MNITVNEELRIYIDPLTPEEHDALERSILAEGCRDALVLWGDMLVDGHNRYGICRKHGIPFQTVQNPRFQSIEDVHLWMIDQHLGRRSVSDFQRGVLALRKKDILAARVQAAQVAQAAQEAADAATVPAQVLPADPLNSREAIARAARISSTTVSQIEKIQKTAAPELVAAVKAGEVSINAAAAVASLPVEEQVAAVAGGKKQLQQ
ncbi:MAG TPA: plasmid replication/partition related protein, partial [Aquabacterium sp.]|nr:plasmid replication/partition related protein [Aquabacterium sp.]